MKFFNNFKMYTAKYEVIKTYLFLILRTWKSHLKKFSIIFSFCDSSVNLLIIFFSKSIISKKSVSKRNSVLDVIDYLCFNDLLDKVKELFFIKFSLVCWVEVLLFSPEKMFVSVISVLMSTYLQWSVIIMWWDF